VHYGMLMRRARRSFDGLETMDLVQETYVEAWRPMAARGPPGNPGSWLWTITCRLAQRAYGNRDRKRRSDSKLFDSGQASLEPWQLAAEAEDRSRLLAGLDRLPAGQANAVRAHYFDYQSCDHLARRYGTTPGAIKTRLYRARRALRAILDGGVE